MRTRTFKWSMIKDELNARARAPTPCAGASWFRIQASSCAMPGNMFGLLKSGATDAESPDVAHVGSRLNEPLDDQAPKHKLRLRSRRRSRAVRRPLEASGFDSLWDSICRR
jgi:hypothetical protein